MGPGAGAIDVNRHARSLLVGARYRRRGRPAPPTSSCTASGAPAGDVLRGWVRVVPGGDRARVGGQEFGPRRRRVSPAVLECPRRCGVSPGGDVLERAGTFHAAGCVLSRAGTRCAFGDRNSVPDGVECPRRCRSVPDGAECPHPWSQTVLDAPRPGSGRLLLVCRASTTPPEAGNVQNGDKGRDEVEHEAREPHDSTVQVTVRVPGHPLCHRYGHAPGRTGSRSSAWRTVGVDVATGCGMRDRGSPAGRSSAGVVGGVADGAASQPSRRLRATYTPVPPMSDSPMECRHRCRPAVAPIPAAAGSQLDGDRPTPPSV